MSTDTARNAVIDPLTGSRPEVGNYQKGRVSGDVDQLSLAPPSCLPATDYKGIVLTSREEYISTLNSITRKVPLREACSKSGVHPYPPQSATLDRLRSTLVNYWYPSSKDNSSRVPPSKSLLKRRPRPAKDFDAINIDKTDKNDTGVSSRDEKEGEDDEENDTGDSSSDEEEGEDEEDSVDEDEETDDEGNSLPGDDEAQFDTDDELDVEEGSDGELELDEEEEFEKFKQKVRMEATEHAKYSRREGGIKTQAAVERDWQEWVKGALKDKIIKDEIIDEHHLLLYIKHCAERPKRTTRGKDIPGTYVGASQIKKLYFGVLRIRKEQDAADPSLESRRPAQSIRTWDTICGRLKDAANRVRNGDVPAEDAPDIVANTFLESITDEQLAEVGKGFLRHRELSAAINGHLAWTAQHATGNRGDDIRSLKLAELQPHVFLHPDRETSIDCVLGLQGEEKAGGRGMCSTINPSYSVLMTHEKPEMCALGALSFYHHYIHDVRNITAQVNITWTLNKSWRKIHLLHGKKSATKRYNERSLYKLYVHAFQKAKFSSRIKAHLPRHVLGYQQQKLGVSLDQTSKLGWVRSQVFHDRYAPAFPLEAILAAHGYPVHRPYVQLWRQVHVPEEFLKLSCPMAEEIFAQVVGKPNLTGTANYWKMVIDSRPRLFQTGAAIYQICPESALFKLPALAHPDVRAWMKNTYPTALALLQASAGNPVDLQRIADKTLQMALGGLQTTLNAQTTRTAEILQTLERRTAIFSPTKNFSAETYQRRYGLAISGASTVTSSTLPTFIIETPMDHHHYPRNEAVASAHCLPSPQSDGCAPMSPIANFPQTPSTPRVKAPLELAMPPLEAFTKQGEPLLMFPAILGQTSVTWEEVFALVKQPELLWNEWRPAKTLENYTLDELWTCYNAGEYVFSENGAPIKRKPPLRLVEQYFQTPWRKEKSARKAWQRFREIPEWVESQSSKRKVSPRTILDELEGMRLVDGHTKPIGLSALMRKVKAVREAEVLALKGGGLQTQVEASTQSSESVPEVSGGKKRKSAPIAPRRKLKKSKIS